MRNRIILSLLMAMYVFVDQYGVTYDCTGGECRTVDNAAVCSGKGCSTSATVTLIYIIPEPNETKTINVDGKTAEVSL